MIDAEGRYFPSHLSPSQLTLYQLCPLLYRERYVVGLFPPPAPERLFGVAVHKGLEAHFRGEDDELVFLRQWSEFTREIDTSLYPLLPALKLRGLELLALVRDLNLAGEPEHQIVFTMQPFTIPFMGFVDLWDAEHHVIYDFKTAAYGWNPTKIARQRFQPAIYSAAYEIEHGTLPAFKFVILPRIARGSVQVLDATPDEARIGEAFSEALQIHRAIEAQQWGCQCRGRYHLFDPTSYQDFEEEVA